MGLFRKKDLNKIDRYTQKNGVRLISFTNPKDIISEQVRMIKTNIEFTAVAREKMKSIVITSPEISDGKSTFSANLAVSWAQAEKKVLFIDADLRRPTLHATFNITNNAKGLTSILSGQTEVEDTLVHTDITGLDIITSGVIPPNPAELLGSRKMSELIQWAENEYDIVILDTPPVTMVTDSQLLISKVDGVVLVIQYGKTQKLTTMRAVSLINHVKGNFLGIVGRRKRNDSDDYGYGYGYGYGDDVK